MSWITQKLVSVKDALWPKPTQVCVAARHLKLVQFNGDYEVWPSDELTEFLEDHKGKYTIQYDERIGKRWIDFKDRQTAVLCRLTFG